MVDEGGKRRDEEEEGGDPRHRPAPDHGEEEAQRHQRIGERQIEEGGEEARGAPLDAGRLKGKRRDRGGEEPHPVLQACRGERRSTHVPALLKQEAHGEGGERGKPEGKPRRGELGGLGAGEDDEHRPRPAEEEPRHQPPPFRPARFGAGEEAGCDRLERGDQGKQARREAALDREVAAREIGELDDEADRGEPGEACPAREAWAEEGEQRGEDEEDEAVAQGEEGKRRRPFEADADGEEARGPEAEEEDGGDAEEEWSG